MSQRHADRTFAAPYLYDVLSAWFGAGSVFLDGRSLTPGRDYREELWPALEGSELVLVLVGPGWNAAQPDGRRRLDDPDDFVRREIARAFRFRIPVLPVLLLDAELPGEEELPEEIARLAACQCVALRPRFAVDDLARLVNAVAALLRETPSSGSGSPAGPGPTDPRRLRPVR